MTPIDNEHINDSGWLDTGDGHQIYWVDWGNKNTQEPIFYLHGGPGSGFSESTFDKFDPARHRVVFHDQRGAGRSTPSASLSNNTTDRLLSDITKLKDHLGFEKISLYGFSWGSTLALLYAIQNPKLINKMLIGGIYLARTKDNDYSFGGGVASHFPEVWEQFRSLAPSDTPDNKVADHYRQVFASSDLEAKKKHAKEWMLYQSSLLRLDYQPAKINAGFGDFEFEPLAYLESHYILNGCFLDENYIIDNTSALRGIERIVIVQGRYDFICAPQTAHDLYTAINSNNTSLQYVESGHSSSDTVGRQTIKAYTMSLW